MITGTDAAGTYAFEVTGSIADGFTVTNTHTPEEVEIKVTKKWEDDNDAYKLRPESVTAILYADGVEADADNLTLNDANNWTGSWTVPKYADGEEIAYTVDEAKITVPGYVKVDPIESNDDKTEFTITNKYEPVVGDPPVKKVVESNTENVPEVRFSFTLTAKDAAPMPEEAKGESSMTLDITMPAEEGKDWKEFGEITFTKPGTYVYTITETPQELAGWEFDNNEITITYKVSANEETNALEVVKTVYNKNEDTTETLEGKESGKLEYFTFTNVYTVVTVEVTKVWEDAENQDGIRPDSVEVKLYVGEEPVEGQDPITLSEDNDWTGSWIDLPKTDAAGEIITYTVKETETDVIINEDGPGTYLITIEEAEGGFTVTNTHTPELIDIDVTKVWDDEDDKDQIRPESITVKLLADGEEIDSVKITEAEEWKHTFTELPKYKEGEVGVEIEYTVEEEEIEGYATKIDGDVEKGFTITNSHKPVPKTGDANNMNLWLGLMMLSAATICIVLFTGKRRKEQE